MTLEEKFWQLFMIPGDLDDTSHDYSHGVFGLQISSPSTKEPAADAARHHAERINAIQRYFVDETRLGIPIIPFEEALHGFVRDGGTMFPQAIGLAATWDTSLMSRVAQAIARETRSRGVRQALSPVINIANDVRWGRVEETYGEDPYLTSEMARAVVSQFERTGVIATPKHFIANVGDGGRDSYPIELNDRTLEELFYPPFDVAIHDAGARSVMMAYNSVDGSPATQNRRLINGKLKGDWGFQGVVISDAAATGGATVLHHTEASTATATKDALEAGLDVIFQSSWPQHRPYLDAFRRGMIADSVIDAAVSRVLRVKLELGLFENPYVNPDSAAVWNGNARHRALALDAARESIVLLRNERKALPLSSSLRSLALIGTDAVQARLGGYSGRGNSVVSIHQALRRRLGGRTAFRVVPGPGRVTREYEVVPASALAVAANGTTTPGLGAEYFDNNTLAGDPRVRRIDRQIDFGWTLESPAREIPYDWYSVRWTGRITMPQDAARRLGVEGNDGYRLWVDGTLVVDNWQKRSYGRHLADSALRPGSTHDIRLEYFESTGNARVKLVWTSAAPDDWQTRIRNAVVAARQSDIAIVVAGIEEGEFRDRSSLGLPGHQEELIREVAKTGTPVVVVLIGGSAITMPWLENVRAVIDAWYPGEVGGTAVADVLFGATNPAGRLPITFPVAEGQLPLRYNHKPTGRGDDYLDLTGQPLFPFGYGLSYTTFEYSDLKVNPDTLGATGATRISFTLKNTGLAAGDEVAQLYIHDVLASVARPVQQLAGFQRVTLRPGESRRMTMVLNTRQLRLLDRDMHWVVEPGTFRVMVGSSSKDIRLRGELKVK
jgi:beta-glucosidase